MNKIIDMETARLLRRMGLPANTKVIDAGEMPKRVRKALDKAWRTAAKFGDSICRVTTNNTPNNHSAMHRAFYRFEKAVFGPPPSGCTDEELALIEGLFNSEFAEIFGQWRPVFDAIEADEEVSVNIQEMWPVVPTQATLRRRENQEHEDRLKRLNP